MTEHCSGLYEISTLNEAERERLTWLIEECGEVVQIACKILRFGYTCVSPYLQDKGADNHELLEMEIGDVLGCIQILCKKDGIRAEMLDSYKLAKLVKVMRYAQHQNYPPEEIL
jgi:NTP pyrophosphatase (non-canonical NTP hydrolase)